MILTILVLLLAVFLGAFLERFMAGKSQNIQLPLVFAGSYLFAITIIHIIPELFSLSENPQTIGLWVLGGFFLQRILEFYSRGIEHGHSHSDGVLSAGTRFSILIALTIHSLMEGSLLTHESPFHEQHESYSLLLGIGLHKVPAAFALMVMMKGSPYRWLWILFFALASPAGFVLSNYMALEDHILLILFAVVCGSFLHISTTIFVESSPEHSLGWQKTLISLLGAGLAITTEYLI
jgi:zinc transporter ZupT